MSSHKVIHVITRLDRGGSAQNTLLTALGHNRSKYSPVMVAGTADDNDAQGGRAATDANVSRLAQAGIPCYLLRALTRSISPVKDLLALGRLMAIFRRENPTLIHTHTSKAGTLGRLAAKLAGVRTVVHTSHGHVFYGHFDAFMSGAFLQIERTLARHTTRLVALTEAERDDHLARGVGSQEQFAVIPSGIDVTTFQALVGVKKPRLSGLTWQADAVVVGSVGWLTPIKGHRHLIEAIAQLEPRFPRLHLLIVGSGDLREELAILAERRGVADAVTFAGARGDIPECLATMDIFVLPSLNEGMGRALIEAMAAGRPVIASRVGGIPALVEHGRNGLLVPPEDPTALAQALTELLQRPEWAKELGSAASVSIGTRFSTHAMVKAIEAVYEDALGHRRS